MGIKTRLGNKWSRSPILKLLRNYAYTGNLLLQRTYRENHITKKCIINHGEKPMYHATGTHEAIIDMDTFNKVQEEMKRRAEHFKHKEGEETPTYPFSGLVRCGRCGKNYIRSGAPKCLLDQSVVAGIGNIYSDEILFRAKIRPSRPANSLNGCEWERLSAVIPECMAFFIEKNAITPEEYLETKGQDYRNTPFLQVYGHDGEACPVCGEILCRTVIGGRSSVYCPGCQRNL